jgi:hypothetical protein
MNQLIKQEVPLKFLPSISINSIELIPDKSLRDTIIAIYNHDKIKKIDISSTILENGNNVVSQSYKRLADIIVKSIYDVGFNISEQEQKALANYLVMEIKNEFGYLTIEEVAIIFKNGSRGMYGEFYGINVKTLHSWVREYTAITKAESILKLNSIREINQKPKELSEEEKNRIKLDWIERVIKDFITLKETGEYVHYDLGNTLYSFFERNKLFILSKKEKAVIYNGAVEEYKRERAKENATSRNQRFEFSNALDKFLQKDKGEILKIKTKAKQLAIKFIFDKAIRDKVDFKKIVMDAFKKEKSNDVG